MNNILFDHVSIGGGVIGFNVIHDLTIKITKNKIIKNKVYNFLIFDKKIDNLIGGIAYGLNLSSYGYFNNPIRLSPKDFVNFIKKNKKFKSDFLRHLKKNSGYIDKIWLKKSFNILNNPSAKEFKELYLPRSTYGIWQKFRLAYLLQTIDNFNAKNKFNNTINLFLGEGEGVNIKKEKNKTHKIILSSPLKLFKIKINIKRNDIIFENTNTKIESLTSCFSTLGLGLNPPKKYFNEKKFLNENYIWDFYAEGSTKNLINKINYRYKKIKKIKVFFIGYKAGLLESLPELYQLIKKENLDINITALSSSLETIQKAEFVKKTPYKFGVLKKSIINKVSKANQILKLIEDEFKYSIDSGFNKYHAWTNILSKNILTKMISRLSNLEKAKYEKKYFTKIRNITRFTYPYPLEIKDKMQEEKILNVVKDKVLKIQSYKNNILVKTINKNYQADIVVNVSGPLSMKFLSDELLIVKNLKKQNFKYNNLGFKVLNNFETGVDKNIYIPGTLSSGFNPNRITILNAILQNSSHAANNISKKILSIKHKATIFDFYKKKFNSLKKTNITKGGVTCSDELMNKIQNNHKNEVEIDSKKGFKIVFDGKAGSGKSTLGKTFSEIFDVILIDTGYIFKATSLKLIKAGTNEKNIQKIQIKNVLKILNQLNLKDLTNLKLDNKKLRPITMFLSKNQIVRKHFNKKIYEFSNKFNSFILTGRDTGQKVFSNKKGVKKFYIETSDKIAAKRKSSAKNNIKTSYNETILRIKSDEKNTKKDLKSILINNDKNIKFAEINILKNLIF